MKNKTRKPLITTIILFSILLSSCAKNDSLSITYSLYPYLLNEEAYKENIESLWYEKHPNIKLNYVDYNCYEDGIPKGIDVIMYDSIMESYFVEEGIIQELDESLIENVDDFFGYSINDLKHNDKLYGIPAILCGNFYIYNKNNTISENAKNIYDLMPLSGNILIHVQLDSYSFMSDVRADKKGKYIIGEDFEAKEELLSDLRILGNDSYYDYDSYELAQFYDQGIGEGYIGYSETLSMLKNRISSTNIKTLSYSESEDVVLLFADAVGLSSNVNENKKDLCIDLMNVITSTEMMQRASINNDKPSYLLFPRKSAYVIDDNYYNQLYKCISDNSCHLLRYPANYYRKQNN